MSQSHRHTPGVSEPWGPHSPAAHLGALPHLVRECLPMRTSRSSTVKFLSQGGYRRQWAAVRTQRSLMRLAPQSSSWGLFRKSITCLRREAGSIRWRQGWAGGCPIHQLYKAERSVLVKAMGFPVVMYGCENWTIKKAERRRIDAFELWCWGRLLRVPWTARRSNLSI